MIKPYFKDEAVTIYHGDCREILPELMSYEIDLVLTDPPYNIGFAGYKSYEDKLAAEEYIGLLHLLARFPRIAISHYPEEMMRFVVPALGAPEHVAAWCYNSNFARRFRLINFYGCTPDYSKIRQPYKNPQDKRIVKLGNVEGTPLYEWWDDIQQVKNVSDEKTDHPCPIPLALASRIVTLISPIGGGNILDPFMGSGTSLRAAKDHGRKAIGIEMEERYCEIAANRMSQTVMPL